MKKLLMFMLSLSLVAVLAACGGGGEPAPEADPETPAVEDGAPGADETPDATEGDESASEGGSVDVALAEEKYRQGCLMCHGHDLAGGSGPELTAVGAKYSQEEIADIIRNGKGTMPGNMLKEEADVELVAAWLSEQK